MSEVDLPSRPLFRGVFDFGYFNLRHKKTFIRKDGFIDDGRMEKLRIYDEGELIEKFSQWFLEIDFYKNWEGDRYAEGDALMILFASGRKEA